MNDIQHKYQKQMVENYFKLLKCQNQEKIKSLSTRSVTADSIQENEKTPTLITKCKYLKTVILEHISLKLRSATEPQYKRIN